MGVQTRFLCWAHLCGSPSAQEVSGLLLPRAASPAKLLAPAAARRAARWRLDKLHPLPPAPASHPSPFSSLPAAPRRGKGQERRGGGDRLDPTSLRCALLAGCPPHPSSSSPGQGDQVTGKLWDLAHAPVSPTLAAFLALKTLLPNFPLGLRPILKCGSVNGGAPRSDVLGRQATWEMID